MSSGDPAIQESIVKQEIIYWSVGHSSNILGQRDILTELCHSPCTIGAQLLSERGFVTVALAGIFVPSLSPWSSLLSHYKGFYSHDFLKTCWGKEKSWRNNCLCQGIWPPNIWLSSTPPGQPPSRMSKLTLNSRYGFKFSLFCHLFHLLCEVILGRNKYGCVGTDLCMEPLFIFARKENILLWVMWWFMWTKLF